MSCHHDADVAQSILCLLVRAFSSFTFKVIIGRYVLTAICELFSGCFCSSSLFLSSLGLFPCELMIFFSVTFVFFSLYFLCMCYRFLVCGYHEVHM